MTIYNMPLWLRTATYNFILESVRAENEAQNKSLNKPNDNITKIDPANLQAAKAKVPNQYIKASKK